MSFSIVIPVYNEAENIPILHKTLQEALAAIETEWEVVYVDDGSTDPSLPALENLVASDPDHVCVVALRRNFGQTAAIAAGIDHATGDVIVLMDADLQNDPADVPMMLEKIQQGYDVVSGWRVERWKSAWLTRRLPSVVANRLISETTGVRLHDYGCSLKAYRREVVKGIRLYGEMHRFIPAVASWIGVAVAEVEVNHHARRYGKSKYGLSRTVRVLLDLLTVRFLLSYSTRPLHIFGTLGLLAFTTGTVLGLYLTAVKFLLEQNIGSRPLLTLAVLLVIVGVQLVMMGLLGEMMVRTYHESQDKPIYVVRDVLE